jgi:hypothetical protein
MYRYQPPKSSVWGHSLRNMKPAKERELFQEFLRMAVAEYRIGEGSLSVSSIESPQLGARTVERFERVLNVKSFNGFFPKLAQPQIDICFKELVLDEQLCVGQHVNLLEPVVISKWLINAKQSATRSSINLYYGSLPLLSTFLRFDTLEEFQCVRDVMQTLKLCRLNDKHLKPVKRANAA